MTEPNKAVFLLNSPSLSLPTSLVSSRERLRGIVSMVAAIFVFSIMDALMKRLSAHYGPLQVSFMRCASSLVFVAMAIVWRRSWATLKLNNPMLHLARGALGVAMLCGFVFAVHLLSLAQTYSLFLLAPLLMTALSMPIYGDRVTGKRWLAIVVGLSGVMLILQPWGRAVVSLAAAGAAAVATVSYALSALSVRSLGRTNSNLSMVFWYLVMVSIACAVLGVKQWQPIQSGDWGWLAGIGVSGALGQLWITDAFRRAPASVVGPFEYTAILWAFAIDWIFWSASPSPSLLLGAAVVIGSGVFVILDERRLADLALTPASPPP
jgi:drug/metabolite transporter (DMT)-like permease